MKHPLVLSLFWGLLFCACQQGPKPEKLIGTWEVMRFSASLPEISPEIIAMAEQEALSYRFSFDAQQQFTLLHHNGEWQLNEQGNQLKMVYSKESELPPDSYQIDYLEDKEMKWTQDMGEMGSLSMILRKKETLK